VKNNELQEWNNFCSEHITEHMPLFETDGLKPVINETERKIGHEFIHGEKLIKHVQKIVDNAKSKKTNHKGIVYIAYTLENDIVVPFYIGKSEFKGRTREFSANVSSRPNGPFLRWGARRDYHLGELMYAYRNDDKAVNKYKTWADYLFEESDDGVFKYGNLKKTAYLAMIPLDTIKVPFKPWPVGVSEAEQTIIGLCAHLFPDNLQNFDGRSRK
jgi:hypothetical protein